MGIHTHETPIITLETLRRDGQEIIPQTIMDTLEAYGWSYARLGEELQPFRLEGPYKKCSYSGQAVWRYAHPSNGRWAISMPFARAMQRLLNDDHLRGAYLNWPDLQTWEVIPHGMSVRGKKRLCACGCGQWVYSPVHKYCNDEHRKAAKLARARARREQAKGK